MPTLFERMLRAAKREEHLYEEVEADASLTREAAIVIVIVALASGIGAINQGLSGLLWGLVFALAGWALWAWIIYFVGTRFLPQPQTHADWGQVARGTGFAQSVGVLHILAFIPVLGWLVSFAAWIWQIVCMVTAVRQALDYDSTGRAVLVVLIGFIPYFLLNFIVLGLLLGGLRAAV